MKAKFRIFAAALLAVCLAAPLASVLASDGGDLPAASVESEGQTRFDSAYCFATGDFGTENLSGIVLTEVPPERIGVLRYGARTLCAGDILDAALLESVRFVPKCQTECDACVRYQPIYGAQTGAVSCFTLHIGSGKNAPPTAQPSTLETYKNIANDGRLSGIDPENGALRFEIVEQPKRGTVELRADGCYVYTPARNKVGEDSFTFTVTDEAGQTSQPATVTVRILKPTQRRSFADMRESIDEYEAMWLRERGLYGGKTVAGTLCFAPDETVTRGEFLVMLTRLLELPTDEALRVSGFADALEAPEWMQPYLAAAQRCGVLREEAGALRPNDAVTAREAAMFAQNALRLSSPDAQSAFAPDSQDDAPLTRLAVARLLLALSEA